MKPGICPNCGSENIDQLNDPAVYYSDKAVFFDFKCLKCRQYFGYIGKIVIETIHWRDTKRKDHDEKIENETNP